MSTATLSRPTTQRPATAFDALVQATAQRDAARIAELRKTAQAIESKAVIAAAKEWDHFSLTETGALIHRGRRQVYGRVTADGRYICDCRYTPLLNSIKRRLSELGDSTVFSHKHDFIRTLLMGGEITGTDDAGESFTLRLLLADVLAAKYGSRECNEVEVIDNVAYLTLKNVHGEPVGKAQIDESDLLRVASKGRWHQITGQCPGDKPYSYVFKSHEGKNLLLHRFLMNPCPDEVVDHINGDTLDNRRENLRVVGRTENAQNGIAHLDSKSGVRNVYPQGKDSWTVQVSVGGHRHCYGTFKTIPEAAAVARAARFLHHSHSPENSGREITPAEILEKVREMKVAIEGTVLCDRCDLAFVFDEDAGDERLNGDGGDLYRCAACVTEDQIAKTELCDRWGIGKAVEI